MLRLPDSTRQRTEGSIRIAAVLGVHAVLRDFGLDPAVVVSAAGFDPALFDNPDNRMSFAARGRLLTHCIVATGCQHFGLLVGRKYSLDTLGFVGLLVKHSPDVETALRTLVTYYRLHAHGATVGFNVDDDTASFSYSIYLPGVENTDQIGDGSVAFMVNILRALCGPAWEPYELQFARRKPRDIQPYRRLCHAPLRFNAEHNAIVFSVNWLSRRMPGADPELWRFLRKQIDVEETMHGGDLVEQMRSILRSALLTDRADADQIAAKFGIHSRTLNRRLHEYGTSFQKLVDEVSLEIARQMLKDTSLEVGEIAAMLDYADGSAFTRAFRRWSGMTPTAWREQRRNA